ncbi:MAG: methylated-DNA--[protein]-cysteine S-methyltransferase [Deltaproteobacteria bacterium]|nr:methylated-DNA--[protein]-cysteine S-methyltransferase [Deltaproteobacteria bacterium]
MTDGKKALLRREELDTPIGKIVLVTRGERLCSLVFADGRARTKAALARRFQGARIEPASGLRATTALKEYFAGRFAALSRIAVDPGGTEFQNRVWSALREVRAGTTASYGTVARAIGAPGAGRAVGAANGANPIAIVIPCHRLVGANGSLTGYGFGLERKRWLLDHEQAHAPSRVRAIARSGDGGKLRMLRGKRSTRYSTM